MIVLPDVSQVISRAWYFTSGDGSLVNKRLAIISNDDEPQINHRFIDIWGFNSETSNLSFEKC